MLTRSNHDASKLTQHIGRLTGRTVTAIAMVCGEWQDEGALTFSHAIEMERAYGDSVLSFNDIAPPDYRGSTAIDLIRLAAEIGVARVYCVIRMEMDGTVAGMRDYANVEVTVLQAIVARLNCFQARLDRWSTSALMHRLLQ